MSLSQDDINKLQKLRDNLKLTYRVSIDPQQKKRIAATLNQVEAMIDDVRQGKWVNPVKISQFSSHFKAEDVKKESTAFKYADKIGLLKISPHSKDQEMDKIYSYLDFFNEYFISVLKSNVLKFDHENSKYLEDLLNQYDTVKKLLDEYINDIDLLPSINTNEQEIRFKERISHQKNYFLIKLNESLMLFKKFFIFAFSELESGNENLLSNAHEQYYDQVHTAKKILFNGIELIRFIEETSIFIEGFLEIIKIPRFRRVEP